MYATQRFQFKLRTFLVILPILCLALSLNLRVYERGPVHLGVQTSCQGWPFAFRRFWVRTEGALSDWNLVNLVLDWHVWVLGGSIVWGLSEHYGRSRLIVRSVTLINGATFILSSAICFLLGIFLVLIGEQYAIPFVLCALLGLGVGLGGVVWAKRTERKAPNGS